MRLQATSTSKIRTQTSVIFARGQAQRRTQPALEGADAGAERHASMRPRHPTHRAQAPPTFLASLYFFDSVPDECPSNPQGITTLARQALNQGSFHAGLIHIPRVRFHIGHVGDGEERHGKARVLTRVVVLFGKRDKRSDRPAQIRLFTTQVI